MTKPRLGAHVDSNQPAIVAALRDHGASVLVLDVSELGAPDLLVGTLGVNHLLEVKPRLGKLRPGQEAWHARWHGPKVVTVRSVPEALRACGLDELTAAQRRDQLRVLAEALRGRKPALPALGNLQSSVRRFGL